MKHDGKAAWVLAHSDDVSCRHIDIRLIIFLLYYAVGNTEWGISIDITKEDAPANWCFEERLVEVHVRIHHAVGHHRSIWLLSQRLHIYAIKWHYKMLCRTVAHE